MNFLNKERISLFLVEIVVVAVGILIAFQVEEWRDRLGEDREVTAALVRLNEETQANLNFCVNGVDRHSRRVASAALQVLHSINSGTLHDADRTEFQWGLATVGFNPRPQYLSTVAEEMISTGVLKNVDDPDLRRQIAAMVSKKGLIDDLYAIWAINLQPAADELNRVVQISYSGPPDVDELRGSYIFEQGIEVDFSFADLVQNQYLRNLLVETTDVHVDRYKNFSDLCEIYKDIGSALSTVGID